MPFFITLETVLRNPRGRITWESFQNNVIAVDDGKIAELRDLVSTSNEAALVGPRDSGKTVTAKAIGFRLLTESGYECFYGNARDLNDVHEAAAQILAYERVTKRILFILEDCHTSTNLVRVETLLQLLGGERRNTVLLLTSRHLGPADGILTDLDEEGKVVYLNPGGLRATIARKHISQLRLQPAFANAPHFPRRQEDAEAQIEGLLGRLPAKNLRVLDIYLRTWDPRRETLDAVQEREVLNVFLSNAVPPLVSAEVQSCFLPVCAIDQFEVGVYIGFFDDRNALQALRDQGLIRCDDSTGLCKLPDPSEGSWYLRAAEQARLLLVDGRSTDVAAYVRHHVLRYAAEAGNPQDLLRSLRDAPELAQEVIRTTEFRANVSRLAANSTFRPDLPSLFFELRAHGHVDLCISLSQMLTDPDLDDISTMEIDVLGRYVVEFLSWRDAGRELAQRLMSRPSVQPRALAGGFMADLNAGGYGVAHLAALLFRLNSLRTYDVCGLLRFLDLALLRAKFPETKLTHYAALLRNVKWARCGTEMVRELTPAREAVLARVRMASARGLRDTMDALLMGDRKRLWADLTDADLLEIMARSTLNQFYNFLEDALESKNLESKDLGKDMATRLVRLGVQKLVETASLKDLSMFIHASIALNPALASDLLDQLVRVGIESITAREQNQERVISGISYMLGDFSTSPVVALRFLQELVRLDLIPFIEVSLPEGVQWLTYRAPIVDEGLSRKWFLSIGSEVWENKIRGAPEVEAFWILWNLFQVVPDLARSIAGVVEIQKRLAGTPHGLGLLLVCGTSTESVSAVLPRLSESLAEPWHAGRLASTLKALSHTDLRDAALRTRAGLDMAKVEETFRTAKVLPRTKELLLAILAEFNGLR